MADDNILGAPSVSGAAAYASHDRDAKDLRARKPKPPDDFEDAEEFLRYVRTLYHEDYEAEQGNRQEAIEDQRFMAGRQWPDGVLEKRRRAGKPALTINRLPAFVAQLVGNRRLSETGIKVIPDSGGDRRVAQVREGLIRSIQKWSGAQYAFDKAFEQQVICGIGNFQVHLDYAHDDVFEQDIRIAAIPNPLAVLWDRSSVDPTGADAEHVFVFDTLPQREFKRRYPDASGGDWDADLSRGTVDEGETVQIASFWRMRSRARILALFVDGTTHDVTDLPVEEWQDAVMTSGEGLPIVREVQRRYAQMYLLSANSILEGPYELPISRVPVFKVAGWEMFVEGERYRWGLIRFLRDPMRLHNYWRSTIAEKLVGAPKAKWIAANTSVEGREKEWRESHLSDDPLLIYNAESGAPPVPAPPLPLEQALVQEAGLAVQDIRDVANIHEASLGIPSNEVSGAAITARQRVGELGSVIYHDHLNLAIEEAGKVINDLIPFVYDTRRTVKTLGPDMLTEQEVTINAGAEFPDSVDVTLGKYRVTVTTGPSYTTRRVEAREEMMAMVNAMPQVMGIAADKIVEAQDWPGAEDIARRLRTQLPPGMLSSDDMDEAQLQQQQAAAQEAQQQQQIQQQAMMLEFQAKQLENAKLEMQIQQMQAQVQEALARAEEAAARAEQARASAAKSIADIDQNEVDSAVRAVTALNSHRGHNG